MGLYFTAIASSPAHAKLSIGNFFFLFLILETLCTWENYKYKISRLKNVFNCKLRKVSVSSFLGRQERQNYCCIKQEVINSLFSLNSTAKPVSSHETDRRQRREWKSVLWAVLVFQFKFTKNDRNKMSKTTSISSQKRQSHRQKS